MSRFLVTGGTGFIGRWVVSGLLAKGHDVCVFDADPKPETLDDITPGLSERVTFVQGDIADGSVREAARGCDGIAHLAAVLTVAAAQDPIRAADINVIGSAQVFEAAREHQISRVAYISSAAVFGPDDAIHPKPMTLYGAHKLAVEGMARAYQLDHGVTSVGFRPYIVYGPGRSSGIAAGPSIAIAAACENQPSKIEFTGRVGFVHVYDVAEYVVAAILNGIEGAEAYTLCGETAEVEAFRATLNAQFPNAQIEITGPPLRIPFDLANSVLPPPLAAVPVTGIADGIAATVAHYRERARA